MTQSQKVKIAGLFMMAVGMIVAVTRVGTPFYWVGWVVLVGGISAFAMGIKK